MNKTSIICSFSLLSTVVVSCDERKISKRPNIIYILADDMGYGDVSAFYPKGKITTPHIDRLTSQGIHFTDAHASASVSTPSRYGILTGSYAWRYLPTSGAGIRGYGPPLLDSSKLTVASLLKGKGYTTAVIGKWHLGLDWQMKDGREFSDLRPRMKDGILVTESAADIIDFSKPPKNGPLKFGFDCSYILPASLDFDPYCYLRNDTLTAPITRFTEGNDLDTDATEAFWRPGPVAEDFDIRDALPNFTRQAVQYIHEKAAKKQPFFLYFPMPSPHTPWLPSGEFTGASGAGKYGDYAAMTDYMVGQILQAVKNAGIEENTIIFFTSDNGPYWRANRIEKYGHRSAGDFRGMKADAWEGGHRVPFIVKWTGHIKAGSVSDALTSHVNLMATVADVVSFDPARLTCKDSYSILPVLLGKSTEVPNQKAIVHHSSRGIFAVRTSVWKLIQGKGSGGGSTSAAEDALMQEEGQLYNMNNDPSETNNLYSTRKDIVQNLSKLLEDIKNQL